MSLVPTAEDLAYGRGFHDSSESYSAAMTNLNDTCNKLRDENERLRAERLKLDRRIHNQRCALRENWEIIEMRCQNWMGSKEGRRRYIWLLKRHQEILQQLRNIQATMKIP